MQVYQFTLRVWEGTLDRLDSCGSFARGASSDVDFGIVGVEDLRELFTQTAGGAGYNEDLKVLGDEVKARVGSNLASLICEGILRKLGIWGEGLAQCLAHCDCGGCGIILIGILGILEALLSGTAYFYS